MKRLRTTSTSSNCVTLNASFAETGLTKERPPVQVSVCIAMLLPGQTIVASSQSFLALVKIKHLSSTPLTVLLPNRSPFELMPSLGDTCLLPPGSSVTNPDSSQDELVQFRLPRRSIHSFARRRSLGEIDTLSTPCVAADSIFAALTGMAVSLLHEKKKQSSSSTASFLTLSLYSHLLNRYGVAGEDKRRFTGGLAPRHKLIAEQALRNVLDNTISADKLAQQCGLSPGHFARAFRQTFGTSFQRHVLDSRIRKAKQLLQQSDASLRSIAMQVGYADQATFTESFSRATGIAPGRYRRRFSIDKREDYGDATRDNHTASREKSGLGTLQHI